jgi:hypothetical protein
MKERAGIGDEKSASFRKPERSLLDSIPSGKRLRLRRDVYCQLKEREWIFSKAEKDFVFLNHPSENYGLVVGTGDLDWDEIEQLRMRNSGTPND